jgi:hypothetical protein
MCKLLYSFLLEDSHAFLLTFFIVSLELGISILSLDHFIHLEVNIYQCLLVIFVLPTLELVELRY